MPSKQPASALCVTQTQTEATRPFSTTPTHLGTLSILPRELRDQIYSYICSDDYYYVHHSGKWVTQTDFRSTHLALTMRNLSSVIRQEYLSQVIFHISDHPGELDGRRLWVPSKKDWPRNSIPFIDLIQKVESSLTFYLVRQLNDSAHVVDDCKVNEQFSNMRAEPVSFFAGTDILRQTCVITLYGCTSKTGLILRSPFFRAIRHLTGFKRVTLKLLSDRSTWSQEKREIYLGREPPRTGYAAGLRAFAETMSSVLEPSLGPSVISDISPRWSLDIWKITFHPRDYISEKNTEAKSAVQVEELAAVLSTVGKD
ncbi:hypothetical protein IMSHALPRED_006766 [Imshaugia aleurites]|uniref:Uncharacterized protein n=1 Tax=Imshaugia aleurites TaxID=172621 RepID=A0A8H3ILW0_9LECA|nr:hypothetical protein IMSHALPRED_006766 [Imshaugia aleurites]